MGAFDPAAKRCRFADCRTLCYGLGDAAIAAYPAPLRQRRLAGRLSGCGRDARGKPYALCAGRRPSASRGRASARPLWALAGCRPSGERFRRRTRRCRAPTRARWPALRSRIEIWVLEHWRRHAAVELRRVHSRPAGPRRARADRKLTGSECVRAWGLRGDRRLLDPAAVAAGSRLPGGSSTGRSARCAFLARERGRRRRRPSRRGAADSTGHSAHRHCAFLHRGGLAHPATRGPSVSCGSRAGCWRR